MGVFALISGGGGGGLIMSTLFSFVKTIEEVHFLDYFCMVKYRQISEFTGVSKGSFEGTRPEKKP